MNLNIAELGEKLATIHRDFPVGEKTTAIHLFGITYGSQLLHLSRPQLDAVAKAAGLNTVYGLELRKMAKLSKYVAAL